MCCIPLNFNIHLHGSFSLLTSTLQPEKKRPIDINIHGGKNSTVKQCWKPSSLYSFLIHTPLSSVHEEKTNPFSHTGKSSTCKFIYSHTYCLLFGIHSIGCYSSISTFFWRRTRQHQQTFQIIAFSSCKSEMSGLSMTLRCRKRRRDGFIVQFCNIKTSEAVSDLLIQCSILSGSSGSLSRSSWIDFLHSFFFF